MSDDVTYELLKGSLEAFNLHDLDFDHGSSSTDDCVFHMPKGARPHGDQYVGKNEVGQARQNDLRGFRMCIMETIGTGSVMILEFLNGH